MRRGLKPYTQNIIKDINTMDYHFNLIKCHQQNQMIKNCPQLEFIHPFSFLTRKMNKLAIINK